MGLVAMYHSYLYDFFGGNEMLVSALGGYVFIALTYWGLNLPFLYVDLTSKPKWLAKYKTQTDQNVPLDREKLKKVLKTVAFNSLVLNLVFGYNNYNLQKQGGVGFHPDGVTSWSWFLVELIAFTLVNEVVFYYSHRLFHHPLIYKYVHKKHHRWTAPISLVSIYATPIEYLTGNGLSVALGPVLMGSHITSTWTWYFLALLFTTIHHSGYHFPFFPSPEFHDYHHLTFNWNYGSIGLLDRVHGTDAQFRRSVQMKRHQILHGMRPMTVLFPEKTPTALEKGSSDIQNGNDPSIVQNGKLD